MKDPHKVWQTLTKFDYPLSTATLKGSESVSCTEYEVIPPEVNRQIHIIKGPNSEAGAP